jgi:hypothetical protein
MRYFIRDDWFLAFGVGYDLQFDPSVVYTELSKEQWFQLQFI